MFVLSYLVLSCRVVSCRVVSCRVCICVCVVCHVVSVSYLCRVSFRVSSRVSSRVVSCWVRVLSCLLFSSLLQHFRQVLVYVNNLLLVLVICTNVLPFLLLVVPVVGTDIHYTQIRLTDRYPHPTLEGPSRVPVVFDAQNVARPVPAPLGFFHPDATEDAGWWYHHGGPYGLAPPSRESAPLLEEAYQKASQWTKQAACLPNGEGLFPGREVEVRAARYAHYLPARVDRVHLENRTADLTLLVEDHYGQRVPSYPAQKYQSVPLEIIRARSLLPTFRDAARRVVELRRMFDKEAPGVGVVPKVLLLLLLPTYTAYDDTVP
jgi:hypothetical protein